jgi:LacI family asc operon transcriptional repressor
MRCDAVIIYPRFLSVDEMDAIVEKCEQPIMVLNAACGKTAATASGPIIKPPARTAVSQLIAKDIEIAFITGSMDSPPGSSVSRLQDALAQHGIPLREG